MVRKLGMGLGYWDDSIKCRGLMGMPHDFELKDPKKNINHICQVSTSKLDLSGYCFFLF